MSTLDVTWWIVALPLLTSGLMLLNVVTWSRGPRRRRADPGRISVLIPARNEGANIEACLRSVLEEQKDLPLEVLVYDDHSEDDTATKVQALALRYPLLRLIRGRQLPPGWNGKSHACHRLRQQARGDVLLYLDADVRLERGALPRLAARLHDTGADVVTAVPRQLTGSWLEHLVVPLLHVTYLAWLWLPLVRLVSDPRVLAANGQLLAVRAEAYDAVGGYAAVRGEIVDDMALCQQMKAKGRRVDFVDGHRWAHCRMYTDARGVWEGFSKNLYAGIGASSFKLVLITLLYLGAFVLPLVALFASLVVPAFFWPGFVGFAIVTVTRGMVALRYRQHLLGAALQPLAVLLLLAIAVNSGRWFRRGAVRWRGRTYAPGGSRSPQQTLGPVAAEAA